MDSNTPNTMQAWTHTTRGHPSSVLSLTTVPIPTITSPHQILVRISHAALNPGASIILHLVPFLFRSTPSIPEMDFSGYVVSVGSSVPALRNLVPGARVFGSIPVGQHVRTTSGALAEYTVVDHSAVCRAPEGIEMEALAGLGIAGATALELVKAAKLKKGDSVLINGASGGVGHLVLQIARAKVGASGRVAAICSTRNVDWVAQLGADEVGFGGGIRQI
jgi:NADPH:quinone reductase-like Zn-dependent oxidoreductase